MPRFLSAKRPSNVYAVIAREFCKSFFWWTFFFVFDFPLPSHPLKRLCTFSPQKCFCLINENEISWGRFLALFWGKKERKIEANDEKYQTRPKRFIISSGRNFHYETRLEQSLYSNFCEQTLKRLFICSWTRRRRASEPINHNNTTFTSWHSSRRDEIPQTEFIWAAVESISPSDMKHFMQRKFAANLLHLSQARNLWWA